MYHNSLLFLPFISTEREREEEGQASSACLNTWLRNRWSNKMPKAVVVAPGNKGPGNKEGRCVEIHFLPPFPELQYSMRTNVHLRLYISCGRVWTNRGLGRSPIEQKDFFTSDGEPPRAAS